ncbi:MAG TPA: sugar phosphate nucleotidyltransferase [Steroidobacter sp.]|uniref:sugar phosphate nucleotidyltransferase n=1 Tax=Steroidobacter sp. TaxID=1978227 RepID=UPI002EDB07F4
MIDVSRGQPHQWALVLAAGDGSRLRALTTQPCGTPVPKQYCSLNGGPTLLEDAMARARAQVAPERVCAIVAQQHHRWWSALDALATLPQANLIVQPRNRGTAIGILYSLLHILSQDAQAQVLLLPSDHYVADEVVLQRGWSDLGPPDRVGETLRRLRSERRSAQREALARHIDLVNLAARHAHFERSMMGGDRSS